MDYVVSTEYDGVLLRTYLKNKLCLSRALVSSLKREQGIAVNGEKVTVRHVLGAGDVVSVSYEDKEKNEKILPVDIPIHVIFEDDDIIVVDKPPFMPVHTSHGHFTDTLANALCFRYKDESFVMRAVNRLDRNTSGIVLVAKNRRSSAILSEQMKKREIGKEYIALVEGIPPEKFLVEVYMKRKGESIIERCVCSSESAGGEYSFTEGIVLKTKKSFETEKASSCQSLVKLIPHTGRTHQLRVHLSYMGFPIVGDELYGNAIDSSDESRQMLHCSKLEFVHPTTEEKMSFSSFPEFDV